MYFEEHFCEHINEVIDQREGTIICSDCGLVVSSLFINSFNENVETETNEYVLEILSRLQIPEFFKTDILNNLKNIEVKHKTKENAIAFVIYKTLNDLDCGVSIKDISAVTGYTDSQIYNFQTSNDSVILDPLIQLEKYCIMLGLPKKSYSVIKGTINSNKTGHNPTTILATAIYKYCKTHDCGVSMKKIAETLNISCVSIQRYIKFEKKKENES